MTEIERTASVMEDVTTTGEHLMIIHQFSKRDATVGKFLRSPDFKLLGNCWNIGVHPNGQSEPHKGYLSVHLFNNDKVDVTLSLTRFDMLNSGGRVLETQEHGARTIPPAWGNGFYKLIERDKLLKIIDNDTLRLGVTIEKIETKHTLVELEHEVKDFRSSISTSLGHLLENSDFRSASAVT